MEQANPFLPRHILLGLVFGVSMLGLASMINAVDDWIDSREAQGTVEDLNTRIIQLNDELACRYRISQPVEDARTQVDAVAQAKLDALSDGLAAFARDNDQGVIQAGERIDALNPMGDEAEAQLNEALQDRADAARICSQRKE